MEQAMSVLKSKRGISSVQFIDTARSLQIYTIKQALKFPKRYTFFITQEVVKLSQSVYNNVKSANNVYVNNQHEFEIRRDYFIRANCDLQCLIAQLDIVKELFASEIKGNVWETWMNLIAEEAKLIAAVMRSDKERYKF